MIYTPKPIETDPPYTVVKYVRSGWEDYLKTDLFIPSLSIPTQEILDNPEALFLFLTQWTVPFRYEGRHYGEMLEHFGFEKDEHGNYFREIAGAAGKRGYTPTIAFTAHMDTSCSYVQRITHRIDGGVVRTDGTTILGADDRAGMTVLLYMMNRSIPGLYCLFVGEEAGCYGSTRASRDEDERFGNIDKIISFDRKGTTSVITHQCCSRTCSDDFALAICKELQKSGLTYRNDNNGLYTDSKEFTDIVAECTNISVGYCDGHSKTEAQNVSFLEKLCNACLVVDWENLPVSREPSEGCDYSEGYGMWYNGIEEDGSQPYRISYEQEEDENETPFDSPFSIIARIVSDFQCGLPVDTEHLEALVSYNKSTTVSNFEYLLDQLSDLCFGR